MCSPAEIEPELYQTFEHFVDKSLKHGHRLVNNIGGPKGGNN